MNVNSIAESRGLSMYRISKSSGIPYATVNDIFCGRARLEKCSAETVLRLAKVLGVSMESLIEPCFGRIDFELFKSNLCHKLKELGDTGFVVSTLENGDIRRLFEKGWYPECLYTLAMLDYICNENGIPLCSDYSEMRKVRLSRTLYSAGVIAESKALGSDEPKKRAVENAIPEFMHFNIAESEVRDVV